jgi:hypothetical protein
MFCRLKDFRRIATRYKRVDIYLSSILLAAAVTWWIRPLVRLALRRGGTSAAASDSEGTVPPAMGLGRDWRFLKDVVRQNVSAARFNRKQIAQ